MEIIPRNKNFGYSFTEKQFTPVKNRINNDEKLIRLETGKIVGHLYRKTNETEWAIQNKATKANYSESKYQTKLILKRYRFNKTKKILGYTNEYINLFTELLASKNHSGYPKERLNLVNYRERVLKQNKKQSYNNFFNLNDNASVKGKNLFSDKRLYPNSIKKQKDEFYNYSPNSMIFKKLKAKLRRNKKNNLRTFKNFYSDYNKNSPSNELTNFSYTNYNDKDSKNDQIKKIKYKSLTKSKINKLFFVNNTNSNKYVMTTGNKKFNQNVDDEDIFHDEEEKLNKEEQFIINGDKDEYEKYLKEKYGFFENKNDKRLQYIKEAKQRYLLVFKNNKVIEKKNSHKITEEYFRKISREKRNLQNPELNKKSYSIHEIFREPLTKKEINNIKLNHNSKNLLRKITIGSN